MTFFGFGVPPMMVVVSNLFACALGLIVLHRAWVDKLIRLAIFGFSLAYLALCSLFLNFFFADLEHVAGAFEKLNWMWISIMLYLYSVCCVFKIFPGSYCFGRKVSVFIMLLSILVMLSTFSLHASDDICPSDSDISALDIDC